MITEEVRTFALDILERLEIAATIWGGTSLTGQTLAEARLEITRFRAENKVLRDECEKGRAAPHLQSRGSYCGAECLGTCDECRALAEYKSARLATDSLPSRKGGGE